MRRAYGRRAGNGGAAGAATETAAADARSRCPGGTDYVLAASWQPGFCETRPSQARMREPDAAAFRCDAFRPARAVAAAVLQHLLQRSGGRCPPTRAGRWDDLPALTLEPQTRAALDEVMPGTQSNLQRHEWIKHGTCHGGTAEDYFGDSIRLMAALNASGVQDLFEASIGTEALRPARFAPPSTRRSGRARASG
ncbi:MAG: hypothetical protein H6891_06615 [Brucellaceae bacterium]|nr:hypothetical protein [Brucellaceae bacterium]